VGERCFWWVGERGGWGVWTLGWAGSCTCRRRENLQGVLSACEETPFTPHPRSFRRDCRRFYYYDKPVRNYGGCAVSVITGFHSGRGGGHSECVAIKKAAGRGGGSYKTSLRKTPGEQMIEGKERDIDGEGSAAKCRTGTDNFCGRGCTGREVKEGFTKTAPRRTPRIIKPRAIDVGPQEYTS